MTRIPRFIIDTTLNEQGRAVYTLLQYSHTDVAPVYATLETMNSFYHIHQLLERLEDIHGSMTQELFLK